MIRAFACQVDVCDSTEFIIDQREDLVDSTGVAGANVYDKGRYVGYGGHAKK
jgi:hypothetical protein